MGKLDLTLLSVEQREMFDNGYKLFFNEDGFLVTEEPAIINDFVIKKRREALENTFKQSLSLITKEYTEEERATFDIKRQEAEIVKAGGISNFLNELCIEGENVEQLADKIIENSNNYKLLYAAAEKKLREGLKNINI